jgi:predicted CxxxxCH...CXXCH cytochrome family protein
MWKRICAVAMLLGALPALGHAASWTLTTQAKSSGGSITSRNLAGQGPASGSLFKSYTTHAPLQVSVNASTGYSIRSVVVNNVDLGPKGSSYLATVQGMTPQSVVASFTPDALAVTAQVSGLGGTASPAVVNNIYYGTKLSTPLSFSFVPQSGFYLAALNGTAGASVSRALPAAANQSVSVSFPAGYVFSGPVSLVGSFASANPVAGAGAPQTALPGDTVTLSGFSIGSTAASSYTWSYLSGPANVGQIPGPSLTLATSGSNASFSAPSTVGIYSFKVTVNGGSSATTSVTVSNSLVAAGRTLCQSCHSASQVGDAQLFNNWSASRHKSNSITCVRCHLGVNSGGHPGSLTTGSVNQASFNYRVSGANFCVTCHNAAIVAGYNGSLHSSRAVSCSSCHTLGVHNPDFSAGACEACHFDSNGQIATHPLAISGPCVTCHDPHTLAGTGSGLTGMNAAHYNNLTGARYPASYVSSRASCTNCHVNSAANLAIRQQWYTSGHAKVQDLPFTAYDFKTRSGCVQCHTTTGFIAFSSAKVTSAWGSASDKTKEVITCIACHSDISSGALRVVAASKPFADDPYRNRSVGGSNLCMDCHSGRNNGSSILAQLGVANFANTPFIAPHYLAAGGSLHGVSGYHFPGQVYAFYSSNSHRVIGMGNAAASGGAGPCIACHLAGPKKHLYQAVTGDPAGNITAINAGFCTNCHAGSLTPASLNLDRADFDNALGVLGAALLDKGYGYTKDYPYFTNTSWGSDQAGANVMGAAFNYVLLLREPGAYAHNGPYAKKLILDSIDAVYNGGVLTGNIDQALSHLLASGAISQGAFDSLDAYRAGRSTGCTSCHTNNTGSHTAHLNQGIGCVACHYATAASNDALLSGSALHANGVKNVVFEKGGSYLAGNCSGVYCHSNGSGSYANLAWGGPKLNCKSCHPTLSARHGAHIGNLLDSGEVTFYNFTANRSSATSYRFGCANCHPVELARHANGAVDLTLVSDNSAGALRERNRILDANGILIPVLVSGLDNEGSGLAGSSRTSVTCFASYCHSNGYEEAPVFATTPDWFGGTFPADRCAACHGNSPNTGIGGSSAHTVHVVGIHALNVFSGNFGNLTTGSTGNVGHGVAAQSTALSCNICHNDTVSSSRNDAGSACRGCHSGQGNQLQIANKALHVNGRVQVSFANISVVSKAQLRPASFAAYSAGYWTRNGGNYKNGAAAFDTSKSTLKHAASWTLGSCSNVACHMGKPVAWSDTNAPSYCALCHTAL